MITDGFSDQFPPPRIESREYKYLEFSFGPAAEQQLNVYAREAWHVIAAAIKPIPEPGNAYYYFVLERTVYK